MKVLQVSNIAGVASLLVQGLRRRGIEADLIVRKPHPCSFPNENVLDVGRPVFLLRVLNLSQNYNITHIHGHSHILPLIIYTFALKTLRTKLVIHLHGTELRRSYDKFWLKKALQIYEQVLVGTPDLLSYYPKAIWLPTPINPAFKPVKNPQRNGKALYFKKWYEPEKEKMVRKECDKMGLKLTVPSDTIPHKEMPLFLNQFEVFFDRFAIPSLSKTGLEALACGCKVISWKGLVEKPEEILRNHSLPVVTQKLIKIYELILSECS